MFATVRQFSDLKVSFTQLALDPNGNDVAALLTCELPLASRGNAPNAGSKRAEEAESVHLAGVSLLAALL